MMNKRRKIITETDVVTGMNRKNRVALGAIGRIRLYFLYKVVVLRVTSLLTYLKRLSLIIKKIRLFLIYLLI